MKSGEETNVGKCNRLRVFDAEGHLLKDIEDGENIIIKATDDEEGKIRVEVKGGKRAAFGGLLDGSFAFTLPQTLGGAVVEVAEAAAVSGVFELPANERSSPITTFESIIIGESFPLRVNDMVVDSGPWSATINQDVPTVGELDPVTGTAHVVQEVLLDAPGLRCSENDPVPMRHEFDVTFTPNLANFIHPSEASKKL